RDELRGLDDHLRLHAGDRDGGRPHGGLLQELSHDGVTVTSGEAQTPSVVRSTTEGVACETGCPIRQVVSRQAVWRPAAWRPTCRVFAKPNRPLTEPRRLSANSNRPAAEP